MATARQKIEVWLIKKGYMPGHLRVNRSAAWGDSVAWSMSVMAKTDDGILYTAEVVSYSTMTMLAKAKDLEFYQDKYNDLVIGEKDGPYPNKLSDGESS